MNRALTSEYAWTDHHLPLNRANYRLLEILLDEAGEPEDKYAVLKPLCSTNKILVEKRKSEWTQYYINALLAGADLDTIPDISNCELITSDNSAIA